MRPLVLWAGLVGFAPLAAAATGMNPWEHYQVIVERAPFGSVTAAGQNAPLPNFAARYVFAGLVPSESKGELLAVIFDTQTTRTELVGTGQSFGDVKLVRLDVDGDNSKVVLQRGLEPATLPLKSRETSIPIAATTSPLQTTLQPTPQAVQGAAAGQGRTVVVPARRRIPFRRGE